MPDFGDVNPDTGLPSTRTQNAGTVDPNAPSVSNGMITPEQWDAYNKKRKWDLIKGLLGTFAATTGLGALGGALGGGAAAGSAAGLGAIEGGAPWSVTPFAGTAASVAPGIAGMGGVAAGAAGGAAGAAGGAAKGFLGGMDTKDLLGLAGILGTTAMGAQGPGQQQPSSATTDPQMQEVIALMLNRLKKTQPLQDSVLSMANGLLPTQYQNGGRG